MVIAVIASATVAAAAVGVVLEAVMVVLFADVYAVATEVPDLWNLGSYNTNISKNHHHNYYQHYSYCCCCCCYYSSTVEIRKRTKTTDIIEHKLKQKLKWAGHIARMKDNRWTKRCTEWQPRRGKRSRRRPRRKWQDDIARKEGTNWNKKATDRRQWKALMGGYILQWMDKA